MKNKANEAGPIAENYETLQGIPTLRKATAQCPLPKASHASVLRSVFQCAEVALLNLFDLTTRATIDLRNNNVGAATKKVFWAYGFHHALVRLSMIPHQFYPVVEKNAFSPSGSVLRLTDSPAATKYREALEAFDKAILECSKRNQLAIDDTLSSQSLESSSFNLLHRARLCNHEATIWEYNLAAVYLPGIEADFQKLICISNFGRNCPRRYRR